MAAASRGRRNAQHLFLGPEYRGREIESPGVDLMNAVSPGLQDGSAIRADRRWERGEGVGPRPSGRLAVWVAAFAHLHSAGGPLRRPGRRPQGLGRRLGPTPDPPVVGTGRPGEKPGSRGCLSRSPTLEEICPRSSLKRCCREGAIGSECCVTRRIRGNSGLLHGIVAEFALLSHGSRLVFHGPLSEASIPHWGLPVCQSRTNCCSMPA